MIQFWSQIIPGDMICTFGIYRTIEIVVCVDDDKITTFLGKFDISFGKNKKQRSYDRNLGLINNHFDIFRAGQKLTEHKWKP